MICADCKGDTIQAKDGVCKSCRLRRCGDRARLYEFSEFMDAELVRIYRTAKTRKALSAALKSFAERHKFPHHIVNNRACKKGLRYSTRLPWSAEHLAFLEEYAGTLSIAAMAKRLKRSISSVRQKLFTLNRSGQVIEGYSQNEFASLLGTTHTAVQRWVARGWLYVDGQGRLPHDAVVFFLVKRMDAYRFANADETWLKQMLQEGMNRKFLKEAA